MRCTIIYYLRMLIAYLHAYIHLSNVCIHAYVHTCKHTVHTHRHVQHDLFLNLIRCLDEPPACVLHQMLAPFHRAQVLF